MKESSVHPCASVNPVDAKMREGKYPAVAEKELPYALGRDVSGKIAPAGDDVASFLIGVQVFAFLSPEHIGYDEYILATSRHCHPSSVIAHSQVIDGRNFEV